VEAEPQDAPDQPQEAEENQRTLQLSLLSALAEKAKPLTVEFGVSGEIRIRGCLRRISQGLNAACCVSYDCYVRACLSALTWAG
jgi:hypothetical protein